MSYQFGPGSDPFGLSLTGWDLVSATRVGDSSSVVAKGIEHGVGVDGNGEYIQASERTFNETTPIEAEYIANDNTIAYSLADIWTACLGVLGAATAKQITEITVRTTNTGDQRARLFIKGHTHGTNTHTQNTYLPDAASELPETFDGYGATDFMACGFGEFDVVSGEVTIRIGHVDKQGSNGDWLVGRSQGVMAEAQTVAISDVVPTTTGNPAVVGSNDWTLDSMVRGRPGVDFGTWTVRGHYFFPASTPA